MSMLFFLDFLAACRAFRVFKELHFTTSRIGAFNHQALAAFIAALTYKGGKFAHRANNLKASPASRTYHIALFNLPQAGRAVIPKRTAAAAFCAVSGVALHKFAAVYAGLLVCRHRYAPA